MPPSNRPKAVKYTEAINSQLQQMQANRLMSMHDNLTKIVAMASGSTKRLAAEVLADLEAYGQTLEREAQERAKAKP